MPYNPLQHAMTRKPIQAKEAAGKVVKSIQCNVDEIVVAFTDGTYWFAEQIEGTLDENTTYDIDKDPPKVIFLWAGVVSSEEYENLKQRFHEEWLKKREVAEREQLANLYSKYGKPV